MREINKPITPPSVQFVQPHHPAVGMEKWRHFKSTIIRAYRSNPISFSNGSAKLDYDYGEQDYRDALLICQGDKCCYCEKPIDGGQLEHFRPKEAFQNSKGSPKTKPGYFWLACSWENLLLSCSKCNSSGQKGILFPIIGFRATHPLDDLSAENHILINPAEEDPTNFISFRKHLIVGTDAASRGKLNISIFKLDSRADLAPVREKKFNLIKKLKLIADLPAPTTDISQAEIDEARIILQSSLNPKEPFSGMLEANISNGLL